LAADIGKNIGLPFKTMSLTDNVAWITALGNDLSYGDIFVEQLKNFGETADVLVAISGSGNSINVVKAVKWARKNKIKTVGLLGFDGGQLLKLVDYPVLVPVKHYGFVEGIHSEIHHYLVEALKLKKNGK
jgi:D-sedoheptulose 7-phosphate isomerase